MTNPPEIKPYLQDFYIQIDNIRLLLYNAKYIQADRKLQGCLTKLTELLNKIDELDRKNH